MSETIKQSAEAKEAGNASFKKGRFVEAVGHYTTAHLLNPSDPSPLLNRAQAYLKLEKWQDCERDCTTVVHSEGQERNIKAFFRRAMARKEMGDISGARADLASVLSMEPGNQAARDEITELAHMKQSTTASNRTFSQHSWPPPRSELAAVFGQDDHLMGDVSPSLSNVASGDDKPLMQEVSTKRTNPPPSSAGAGAGTSTSTTKDATPVQIQSQSFAERKAARDQGRQSFARRTVPPTVSSATAPDSLNDISTSKSGSHGDVGGGDEMEVDEPAGDVAVAPEQLKPKDQEHVKPPPVTGLEFLDRFEDLADVADRWALITSLPPNRLAHMVSGIIEPDHLARLLTTFQSILQQQQQTGSSTAKEEIRQYLAELRAMKRYTMLTFLLSNDERRMAEEAWNQVSS